MWFDKNKVSADRLHTARFQRRAYTALGLQHSLRIWLPFDYGNKLTEACNVNWNMTAVIFENAHCNTTEELSRTIVSLYEYI